MPCLPFVLPVLQLSLDCNLAKTFWNQCIYLVFYFGGNMSGSKSCWWSYKVSGHSKETGASFLRNKGVHVSGEKPIVSLENISSRPGASKAAHWAKEPGKSQRSQHRVRTEKDRHRTPSPPEILHSQMQRMQWQNLGTNQQGDIAHKMRKKSLVLLKVHKPTFSI